MFCSKENEMQRHIRFAIYDLTKGSFQELADLAKGGMLPIFSKEPGFIEYGVGDLGNRKVCSITIWESRDQAEKSVHLASSWVKENVSDRVHLVTSYVGDLAFLAASPVYA
jgi:heme-degrading monooxygenase HmoA